MEGFREEVAASWAKVRGLGSFAGQGGQRGEAVHWVHAGLEVGTKDREPSRGLLNVRLWHLRVIREPWGDMLLSSPALE